jgi:hypothetical protein
VKTVLRYLPSHKMNARGYDIGGSVRIRQAEDKEHNFRLQRIITITTSQRITSKMALM